MRACYVIYGLMLGLILLSALPVRAPAGNPCANWPADPRGEMPPIMGDHMFRASGRVKSLRVDVYAGESRAGGGVAKRTPEQRAEVPYSLDTLSILGEYPVFAIKEYPSLELYSREGVLTERVLYDSNGAPAFRVRPTYGESGRLESETVCRGTGTDCAVVRYAYDPQNGLLAAITPDAAWFAMGREFAWGETIPCSVRYEYDGLGRLIRMRGLTPAEQVESEEAREEVLTFTYEKESKPRAPDGAGRLRSVTHEVLPDAENPPLTFHYRYEKDASGLWRYEERNPGPAGNRIAVLRDGSGNVLRLRWNFWGATKYSEEVYERDDKGRITRFKRNTDDNTLLNGNLERRYEYDGQGRLIRTALDRDGLKDWLVETYEYDERGNWIRAEISDARSTPHDGGGPRPVVIERRIEYWE